MEAVMSQDFEDRFFDSLGKRLDKQDDKLEKILTQVQYTNGRVTKLEDRATVLEKATGRKLNIPNNILYLLAVAFVIVLVIVANLMGINIKGVL